MTTETNTTTTDLDQIERAIATLGRAADTERHRDVEAARAWLAPFLPPARAALTALDDLARDRGDELGRAQRILGNPALDAIEGLRGTLRWARQRAADASASLAARSVLAQLIDEAERFDVGTRPGHPRMKAAGVLAALLREQSEHPAAATRRLDALAGDLSTLAARSGQANAVTPRMDAPPWSQAPPMRVQSDFDALGRP